LLRTFPTAYPDELLFSVLARYHVRSGNTSFKQSVIELFDYTPQSLYWLTLPNNLRTLSRKLYPIANQITENLIEDHTLFPFYRNFLTPIEASLLRDSMVNKAGKPVVQLAKISMAEPNQSKQLLKFCPACFENDISRYGEAYWHRTHQIPGILVCLEHKTLLHESLVSFQDGYLSGAASSPENYLSGDVQVTCQECISQKLIEIAKEINELCNTQVGFRGFRWLREQYQHRLAEQDIISNFRSKKVELHAEKLENAILAFYGWDCLNLVKPGLADRLGRYCLRCLLACDVEPTIDRVTHVLLIKFLFGSVSNYLEASQATA